MRRALALACAGAALIGAPPVLAKVDSEPLLAPGQTPVATSEGRRLFLDTCSSCHGADARGLPGRGPSLRGVGVLAADFYLRTNRMPLDDPKQEPKRHPSNVLDRAQKRALAGYVGSLGGPGVPVVDPSRGDIARGQQLFTEHCAGCHQVMGRGGIMPDAQIPDLHEVQPLDVAEAVAIGPYAMPRFPHLDRRQVDDIARYVEYVKRPDDRGGWAIGHIGPVPEGMVTWLLAAVVLLVTIRIIGERAPR